MKCIILVFLAVLAVSVFSQLTLPTNTVLDNGQVLKARVSGMFTPLFTHPSFVEVVNLLSDRARRTTVFLPTMDDVQANYFDATMSDHYLSILKHHMINKNLLTAEIRALETKDTWQSYASMYKNQPLKLQKKNNGQYRILSSGGWIANIVQKDIRCANGVIHLIDNVLTPTGYTLSSTAVYVDGLNSPPNFSTTVPPGFIEDSQVNGGGHFFTGPKIPLPPTAPAPPSIPNVVSPVANFIPDAFDVNTHLEDMNGVQPEQLEAPASTNVITRVPINANLGANVAAAPLTNPSHSAFSNLASMSVLDQGRVMNTQQLVDPLTAVNGLVAGVGGAANAATAGLGLGGLGVAAPGGGLGAGLTNPAGVLGGVASTLTNPIAATGLGGVANPVAGINGVVNSLTNPVTGLGGVASTLTGPAGLGGVTGPAGLGGVGAALSNPVGTATNLVNSVVGGAANPVATANNLVNSVVGGVAGPAGAANPLGAANNLVNSVVGGAANPLATANTLVNSVVGGAANPVATANNLVNSVVGGLPRL